MGTPYDVICSIFEAGRGPCIATVLKSADYTVCAKSCAYLWVRAPKPRECSETRKLDDGILLTTTTSGSETPKTNLSNNRKHLSPRVRWRMKELCNSICPRGEDGVMLSESSKGKKRPAWCIHAIMDILRSEFESSELDGVQEKAMVYMSRNALMFTRLKQLSEIQWLAMEEKARESKRALLDEHSIAADTWRKSAYGYMWEDRNIKRQPTVQELEAYNAKIAQMEDPSIDSVK